MKKVLFICPTQYGYNTDYYKYCEKLSKDYDVTYLGIDLNYQRKSPGEVRVIEIKPTKFISRFILLFTLYKLEKLNRYDKIFIYSFPFAVLSLLFAGSDKMILDIRTSIISSRFRSYIFNKQISIESYFFRLTTVISSGVADYIGIKSKEIKVLPLGAEWHAMRCRDVRNTINLLYVGTFFDRHIEKTVEGVSLFLKEYYQPDKYDFSYTIIGFGKPDEVNLIKKTIEKSKCEKYIKFVGEKRFEELEPYFEKCNIGMSYIPLTDYYDCQPPTKTFEYLLNSMIVLATPTTENKYVVNSTNGDLTKDDTPESVAKSLKNIQEGINNFNYSNIFRSAQKYTWDQIVSSCLIPIIEE